MSNPITDLLLHPGNPKDNQGPAILYTIWFLIGTSTIVIAARLWVKLSRTRRIYYDDMIMVFALILGILHAVLTTMAVHYGLGRHFLYLPYKDMKNAMTWGILTLGWGNLSPMAGRIAFCVTMLFLAKTDPRVKRWPIWCFIAGQLLLNISAVTFFYSQCGTHLHVLTNIDYAGVKQYCLNPAYQTDYGYFVGAFNCLTDAFLTVLPAILINHTRLTMKRKIGLGLLLCLSIVALAAAITKTYEAKALSEVSDYTYDLCIYVIWVSIELNIVIVVASIPILRALFRRDRRYEAEPAVTWDTLTLASLSRDKGHHRASVAHRSMSSEENMVEPPDAHEMNALPGIHVTREVSITYQPTNIPFVHATLVGLIHGQIANPWLVQN